MSFVLLNRELTTFCTKLLPRMLTQVCRDPDSAEYGSFDRNWWHYKIRDFSSIILQQGGYALYCASLIPEMKARAKPLKALAAGSAQFWNLRARKFRAFEEYYPWEEGYPPVAFSTLAIAKLVDAGVVDVDSVYDGLQRASSQLLSRFEGKATNQQVAGTAALCWIYKIAPALVDKVILDSICSRTLACQHSEGWYMEYGGPDLGYLSVTMDCLWDAFDATSDNRFRESAARALDFISAFTRLPSRGAGMHNARNTDYIVPYGIARFLGEQEFEGKAREVLVRVFENISDPGHFIHAVDDRYFCHYIGHSFFRALQLLTVPSDQTPSHFQSPSVKTFPGTGHFLFHDTPWGGSALISGKKGAVFTLWFGDKSISDYGWIVSEENAVWVSHWWGDFWEIESEENQIVAKGYLTSHKPNESTPLKHMVLRVLSLLMGRKIIGMLKEKMIFKEKQNKKYSYVRQINFGTHSVTVNDFIGLSQDAKVSRASRSSKRHVASADSCHPEDLCLVDEMIEIREKSEFVGEFMKITTVYRAKA